MDQLGSCLKSCLLCGESTSNNGDNDNNSKISQLGGIVGGVNCVLLERQLEKMFVLLKVLEVPSNWCEVTLQNGGGDSSDNNPDKWFKLCDKCVEGNVTRAWTTYQKLLKWQTRMLSVRLQIREGMRQSILKDKRRNGNKQSLASQVDCEIKIYLFPELFTKVESPEELDGFAREMDFDLLNDDKEDNAYQNKLSVESPKDKLYPTGRKRGRPRKSNPKPPSPLKIDGLSTKVENDPLNLVEVNFDHDLDPNEEEALWNDNDDGDDHDQDNQPEKEADVTAEDITEDKYSNDSDSDYQPEEVTPKPSRRPRGRPPGPGPHSKIKRGRPRIHAPGTYSYRGSLRTKRFHWSICSICDARYPSTEDYTSHMALHSQRDTTSKGPLDCTHCPFPARDPQELDYHLRRRHSQKPPKLKQHYSCPKCPFTTNRWKYFKEHADIDHPTVPISEFGSDLSLKCPECDKQHVNIAQYQKHRHMEHPEDKDKHPVICPQCGIKFLSKSLLDYHVNSVHERPLRHICDECGKGYEFLNGLIRHQEGHLKKRGDLRRKREHVCEECGMDFYDQFTYRKHFKKQHGGKTQVPPKVEGLRAPEDEVNEVVDKVIQCKYCDVRSSLPSFIKRHVQEEHKGEMAYQCDKCERRYTNAQGLKRHVRLNHGNEECPCPHCGKKFKGEEYMKDHVKKFCKLKILTGVGEEGMEGEKVSGGQEESAGGLDEEHKYYPVENGGDGSGICILPAINFCN